MYHYYFGPGGERWLERGGSGERDGTVPILADPRPRLTDDPVLLATSIYLGQCRLPSSSCTRTRVYVNRGIY